MVEIVNGSDFKITATLKDKDGVVIPYTQLDWEILYYTNLNYILKVYNKNGVLSSNCEIVGDEIIAHINSFNWGVKGQIWRQVKCSFIDSEYPDGKATISVKPVLIDYKII